MPDFDFTKQFEAMQCLTQSGTSDAQLQKSAHAQEDTGAFRQAPNEAQEPLYDDLS